MRVITKCKQRDLSDKGYEELKFEDQMKIVKNLLQANMFYPTSVEIWVLVVLVRYNVQN